MEFSYSSINKQKEAKEFVEEMNSKQIEEKTDKEKRINKKNEKNKELRRFIIYSIIALTLIGIGMFALTKRILKDRQSFLDEELAAKNKIVDNTKNAARFKDQYEKFGFKEKPIEKSKVLIITNVFKGDFESGGKVSTKQVYDILYSMPFLDVEYANPKILAKLSYEEHLSKYKCLIYDLKEYGYAPTPNKAIEEYLSKGGAVLTTHDHWFTRVAPGPSDFLDMIRIKDPPAKKKFSSEAAVFKFHPILKSYFNLDTFETIPIKKTLAIYNLKKEPKYKPTVVLTDVKNTKAIYLLVNEVLNGKIVFWNVSTEGKMSPYESLILVNILAWIVNN